MKVSLTVGANTNSTKQRSHTYWHTKSKIFPGCGRMGRQFSRIFRNYYHYPITDIVCKKQKFSIGSVWASCWKLRVFLHIFNNIISKHIMLLLLLCGASSHFSDGTLLPDFINISEETRAQKCWPLLLLLLKSEWGEQVKNWWWDVKEKL